MTTSGPVAVRIASDVLAVPGVIRLYPGGAGVSVGEHDGTTEVLASIGTDGASPAIEVALGAVAAARTALGSGAHRVTVRIASVG